MKKQLITPLILVLSLTTIAQPSFAMKRSLPGPLEMSFMVKSFVSVVGWFWAKHTAKATTFESRSRHRFAVPASDLNAFLQLTPTIANMFSDLEDIGMTIPLSHVSNPALYLLTQMASGAEHGALLHYISMLSPSELQRLKEETHFLDSKKLKALICRALHEDVTFVSQAGHHYDVPAHDLEALMELSPSIATLLWDLAGSDMSEGIGFDDVHDAALILLTIMASGVYHPGLPSYIRSLNFRELEELKRDTEVIDSQALKDLILKSLVNAFTDLPTDKLPIVATIHVGRMPHQPVIHDHMLYVLSEKDGILTVIDLTNNQVVTTMLASTALQQSFAHGQRHYEANLANGTVKVVDAHTDEVIAIIQVIGASQGSLVYDQMLYVVNANDGMISVIDISGYLRGQF